MSRPFNSPDVFRAVADPTRRRMLELLRVRDRTPGELTGEFRITRPAISQHLRALRTAGLVREQRSGRGLRYSLAAGGLSAVAAWIAPFRFGSRLNSASRGK